MSKLKIEEITIVQNPRKDFSAVPELVGSIEQYGQLVPVLVRRAEANGGYVLIDGESRILALRKLGKKEVEVYIVEGKDPISETQAKEMQMTANLCRSDLALIERMRGFAALLQNAPTKYNALTVARKFGYKEKEIQKMVSVVRKINPDVDQFLASGRFEFVDMENLAGVPADFHLSIVKEAIKGNGTIQHAIYVLTEEVWTDSVFTLEQAKAAGKIHYKTQWTDRYRTFDKDFAKKTKEEFEARTKKKYQEEKDKAAKQTVEKKEKSAEQKKKEAEKERHEKVELQTAFVEAFCKFIRKKVNPQTLIEEIVHHYIFSDLTADDCKFLLRAFGIPFKASDFSTSDLRNLLKQKVIKPLMKNETHVVNFVEAVKIERPFTGQDSAGFKKWLAGMKKSI